ncbi:hypothetical protein POTOM_060430 [Populus tomentosa]|uniref:Proteasomal ubiquitin receptor ADRM1 n=1 Tax=Populus tomentosa TaxID=118781 RepID=A0A8X8C100_POPTO|nr:hypothetical protein POTOM_060430 [Populus tomentosa]
MGSLSAEDIPAMQEIVFKFRSGKMVFYGKKVVPDSRKGLVRIGPGDEGLLHFQWLDRNLNVVEDLFLDVLIDSIRLLFFSEEAVFEKVNQALGRVYILKFNTDDRKFFIWMQLHDFGKLCNMFAGAKAKDDSQLCSSVNYYINRPFEFLDEEDPDTSTPFQVFEDMLEDNISSRTGNLVVPDLGAEVTSSSGPVKLEDLQRILSNIGGGGSSGDPDEGLGLGDILKPDLIMPLNETLPLEEGLTSHLPEGHWTLEDILDLLQSPPFRQQVNSFT